ncbi:MAG: (3S)-malyl-CoA thiolesterase [Nocardia sp.]|uniref:HpcH/HpaI aldolase/citrate lyase family protein n=1 Tax=Nocardia sp. TaxID=1821 RepID=UPI0026357FF8|nr:CoA ester lyase [Nocardia sp.]MCU1646125.1 (3S)-malyl-CoA thiolesterase [Nocardia sp.]
MIDGPRTCSIETATRSQSPTARRRAVLVAPGSDERKALRALRSQADEVVIDLEDSVSVADKSRARTGLGRLIGQQGRSEFCVRINSLSTSWGRADVRMCADTAGITSIVVPKVETAADLLGVAAMVAGTPIRLQALIETPRGLTNIGTIAQAVDSLDTLIIGYADLGALLGRAPDLPPKHWLWVQDQVLVAARAAGIQAIDGPCLSVADDQPLRESAEWSQSLGFDGKWVIHPAQISTVTDIFTPSPDAVEHARRVLDTLQTAAADGIGAVQLEGQMIDEAVAVAARRVLTLAAATP